MKKELYYKILSIFVLIYLLLINIAPFSIKAYFNVGAPFLGANLKYYDISSVGSHYSTTYDLDFETVRYECSNYSSTQGCRQWSTDYSASASSGGASGSTDTQIVSITDRYLYELEFILDNDYFGYFTVVYFTGANSTGTRISNSYVINGNSLSITTNSYPFNVQISSLDLTLKQDSNIWYFPIETYPFASQLLNLYNDKLVGISNYDNYFLPQFNLNTNDIVYSAYLSPSQTQIYVLLTDFNISNQSSLERVFTLSNGQLTFIESLSRFQINGQNYRIIKFSGNNTSGSNATCNLTLLSDRFILPIYSNLSTFNSISTDFALNFGLSNSLLDNINIIANGNINSNDSVGNNDNNNQLLDDTNNEYETIEQQFNNDMNDKLDDINMNSDLLSNQDFLNSASFVKTQFNRLLNNTILGSLITFFLLLGLASIFIGRNK